MNTVWVAVRKDIPWSHRLVQSCHAVLELRNPPPDSRLLAFGVDTEDELEALPYEVAFREPDLGDIITAVAGTGDPPAGLRLV